MSLGKEVIHVPSTTSSSLEPDNQNQDVVNNSELIIREAENMLANWSLPEVSIKEVYRHSTFDLVTREICRTVESTHPMSTGQENLYLLDKHLLNRHRKDKFNYLHVELIQVAVKPL